MSTLPPRRKPMKRTPLGRGTKGLQRGSWPARGQRRARGVSQVTTLHAAEAEAAALDGLRLGHFPDDVRAQIYARPRLEGRTCELEDFLFSCRGRVEAHHRKAKGAGGCTDPRLHVVANGLAVCARHHAWVHNHPTECELLGLIVPGAGDFDTEPVSFDGGQTRRWLAASGLYACTKPVRSDTAWTVS
jgi:hypothetical protein